MIYRTLKGIEKPIPFSNRLLIGIRKSIKSVIQILNLGGKVIETLISIAMPFGARCFNPATQISAVFMNWLSTPMAPSAFTR